MSSIRYNIEFFSDWHCGSGLAAGADVDALVVVDSAGMPFVPGKTIKGLIRQAVEEVSQFRGLDNEAEIKDAFGLFDDSSKDKEYVKGLLFFTNAVLPKEEYNAIVDGRLQKYMFRSISSTAIGDDGIAKEHSLRKMQVVVPCRLEGEIIWEGECPVSKNVIADALNYVKRLGVNRNRGLGRCKFSIVKEG